MNNNQDVIIKKTERNSSGEGSKIIQMNISDPSENLFAVVTPIKLH